MYPAAQLREASVRLRAMFEDIESENTKKYLKLGIFLFQGISPRGRYINNLLVNLIASLYIAIKLFIWKNSA